MGLSIQPFTAEESGGPPTPANRGSGVGEEEETTCHTASLSLVWSPLEIFQGQGLQNMVKNMGEGFKTLPERHQITKCFLLIRYAPGLALAMGDTKMMVTSLSASSCDDPTDHPWAQIFYVWPSAQAQPSATAHRGPTVGDTKER